MIQGLAALLPWKMIARMCVGKYLTNPKVKEQIVGDLRAAALETKPKWDDAAVETFAEMWDHVVPSLVKKI